MSQLRIYLWCILFLVATISQANAYWNKGGVAVSTVPSNASYMQASTDSAGGAIVVWLEHFRHSTVSVYAQRFDVDGNAMWDSGGVLISDTTSSVDEYPRIVPFDNGWLITWIQSLSGGNLQAARVDHNGDITDSGQLGSIDCTGEMRMATVDGNKAILVWRSSSTGPPEFRNGIRALCIYDDLTVHDYGLLDNCGDTNYSPFVVPDNEDGAIVVWKCYATEVRHEQVKAQRIAVGGGVVWDSVLAVVDWGSEDCEECRVDVVSDNNGGAVIAFEYNGEDIVVQRVDASGDLTWASRDSLGRRLCDTCDEDISNPAVATDTGGNAIVAFEKTSAQGNIEVYAMKLDFDSSGWDEPVRVQDSSEEDGFKPRIAANSTGGAVITWLIGDEYGGNKVWAQSLDENGNRFWDEDVVLSDPDCSNCIIGEAVIVEEYQGGAIVVWTKGGDGMGGVFANRLSTLRISDPVAVAIYSEDDWGIPNLWQYWDVDVSFHVLDSLIATNAWVFHGPAGCDGSSEYSRLDVSDSIAVHHDIALNDEFPGNDSPNRGELDPVSMYFYRVVPGGMPAYEDSVPLQQPRNYPLLIDGEDATVEPDTGCVYDNQSPCFNLVDNGEKYEGHLHVGQEGDSSIKEYIPTVHMPNLVEGDRRMGAHSISFRTDSIVYDPSSGVKQRSKLTFLRNIPFQEERFDGFSMKITEDSKPPTRYLEWTVLTEWWQDNECPQPLALSLEPGNRLWLRVANEDHYGLNKEEYATVADEVIPIGEWVDVVIGYCIDPYGECGYAEMWLDGDPVGRYPPGDGNYAKIGFPEPWHRQIVADTVYYEIRQFVRGHILGIYRRGTDKDLEVRYDEIRHGFTYDEVAPPPVKITNPEVITEYDSLTSTWNATITFETDSLVSVKTSYGPITDDCICCTYEQDTTVTDTNYTIVLEGLQGLRYCYQVETINIPKATIMTGTFELIR
jgi:hypothetical protein